MTQDRQRERQLLGKTKAKWRAIRVAVGCPHRARREHLHFHWSTASMTHTDTKDVCIGTSAPASKEQTVHSRRLTSRFESELRLGESYVCGFLEARSTEQSKGSAAPAKRGWQTHHIKITRC